MITFFFRKPQAGVFSIEELFKTVQKELPAEINFNNYFLSKKGANIQILWANGKEAASHQTDVNHITGDVHYIAPFLVKDNTILTIHDLRPLFRGNIIKRKLIKWLWFSIPVHSVRYITVISQATKEELIKHVGVNPEKIKVIPNCVSKEFYYRPKEFNKEEPRVLHIGTKENKNLERLIEAVAGVPCILTIVGRLTSLQIKLLTKHNVIYENKFDLSFQEVVEAYRKADLISFVSLYEGFGLPIIEGQATGRPILTSNISSMPEVAGEGAFLVNPYNVEDIKNGLIKLMSDKDLSKELVNKGFENVKRFEASAVAAQYAQLYNKIMEKRV